MALGNANWIKGLQAMSDWAWSGNLNPEPFPNNLARYFLHIPAVFEQQLNFSTTLIFDEPSFRNGIQMSGFLDRVHRELAISFIGQSRHCWYTITHHAVLGYLTAKKHGLSDADFTAKWTNLIEFKHSRGVFSELETAVLEFAEAFSGNPKNYTDNQYGRLRQLLQQQNETQYAVEGKWMQQLQAARAARALATVRGLPQTEIDFISANAAAAVADPMPISVSNAKLDAQIVELAFLCLQFVALTGVFTALNIPDEAFLAGVMQRLLPPLVIRHVNDLCANSGQGLPELVPPRITPPIAEIEAGAILVEPSLVKGSRLPLESYELKMDRDPDKGLTVGGVQVGTYGWSFGTHFPGSLVYSLMLHPELARYEAPYSLPLLFNEDEWRNGVQTGGFVSRLLKELVYQKVYKTTRSRYGLEHHTMFLFNSYLDYYGVGRPPSPKMTETEKCTARETALKRAERAVLYILDHETAPSDVFTELEKATLSWVDSFLRTPHSSFQIEKRLRQELIKENVREISARTRKLDKSPGLGDGAAMDRLVDHQVAELAMITGHMDGLGRALTILQLQSEDPVQIVEGDMNPVTGNIKPKLTSLGEVQATGYFNNRRGLIDFMANVVGVTSKALTMNELMANPLLNDDVKRQLRIGERKIRISAAEAAMTAEF